MARGSLGTINHTVLTAEAVTRDQQSIAAVVLSCRPGEDRGFVEENAAEIRRQVLDRVGEPARVLVLWDDPQVLRELLTEA